MAAITAPPPSSPAQPGPQRTLHPWTLRGLKPPAGALVLIESRHLLVLVLILVLVKILVLVLILVLVILLMMLLVLMMWWWWLRKCWVPLQRMHLLTSRPSRLRGLCSLVCLCCQACPWSCTCQVEIHVALVILVRVPIHKGYHHQGIQCWYGVVRRPLY